MIIETFKTISASATSLFKDRNSKFIGYCYPFTKVEEGNAFLKKIKDEHSKARHFCYAYRLGADGSQYRANDNGEPSGSAGLPILGQIDSKGVTNTLVVVVRYFGGTLLGVPGLINAYKTAAQECLAQVEVVEKDVVLVAKLSFEYPILNIVLQTIKQFDLHILKQEMLLFCEFEIEIPLKKQTIVLETFNKIYGLTVTVI